MYQFDIQNELLEAFKARDLNKFKKYIKLLNKTVVCSNDPLMNIFEKVLSTPGCFKFVQACVSSGCAANYVNPKLKKAAINYAVDSLDSENIEALLLTVRDKEMMIVDYLYEGETPLITLCKNLCPENVENSILCIRSLIDNCASPNIPDREGRSLLFYVLQNDKIPEQKRNQLTCELLASDVLNEKDYRCGVDFVLQNNPDGNDKTIYPALIRLLLSLSTAEMLDTLTHWQKIISNWNSKEMQWILFEHCSNQSVENALPNLVSINNEADNLTLLQTAINFGNWKFVKSLLKTCQLSEDLRSELQECCIRDIYNERACDEENYKSCLELLINEDCPPLEHLMHMSVECDNSIAIQVLLRHGVKLKGDKYDIRDMEVDVLEQQFNNCITGDLKDRTQLYLNFKSLVNKQNEIDIDNIFLIAQEKKLRPLLKHPLIDFLLQLQWMRSRNIYFVHFSILIIFNILLMTQVCLRFTQWNDYAYSSIITCVLYAFIILFLLIDILLSFLTTRSLTIFKDILLVVLLILICIETDFQRAFAILVIMLMALKLIVLIGALPFLFTFTEVIAQYSIYLIIYALCFFVLFASPDSTNLISLFDKTSRLNETNTQVNVNQSKPFQTLPTPPTTFPKTLTMFFGQYDIEMDFRSQINSWMWILFSFLAMILTNLLTALAISYIQAIQSQAEINNAICRVNLLKRYRAVINVLWLRRLLIKNECPFDTIKVNLKFGEKTFQAFTNNNIIDCLTPKRKCILHSRDLKLNEKTFKKSLEIIKRTRLNAVKKSCGENKKNQVDKRFQEISAKLVNIQEQSEKRFEDMSTKLQEQLEIIKAMLSCKAESS